MSKLTFENHNRLSEISNSDRKNMNAFCDEYKSFMNKAKTEREFTTCAKQLLEDNGFVDLGSKQNLKRGDKVYTVNRGKGIIAAVIGSEPLESGISVVGSHIDSPRLDLKPNPLYEDNHIAYFKTHYYGGVKKYQWTAIPLSLHGVATLKDGTQIRISIGEDDSDPTFVISDLLPHFAAKQMAKKLSEAIEAESLNIIIGNEEASNCDETDMVKQNILNYLNEKYDISEEDFISAEIEAVPAFKAKDLGFDRSMIAAYGHDDRVCAYAALKAVIDVKKPKYTAVCLLVDKEEIGSVGNTGMRSRHFENVLAKMISMTCDSYNDLMLRETISNSICFSADVCSAFDPNYPEASEKRNIAVLNGGIGVVKYSGSGGKSGASDASAELMATVRRIFSDGGVMWQASELGKTDAGGGGTISGFVANLDMDVVDIGVPLLSMHAPYEIAGKLDIFMGYKGYKAFFER